MKTHHEISARMLFRAERERRTRLPYDRLCRELAEIAERIAATGGPRSDDLSVAERLATLLHLPMSKSEAKREEAEITAWLAAHGYGFSR